MTNNTNLLELLLSIIDARDELERAGKMHCTCSKKELMAYMECNCDRGFALANAKRSFWRIINSLEEDSCVEMQQ